MQRLDSLIHRGRYLAAVFSLLFIVYCGLALGLAIPFTDFGFHWRPEDRLVILEVPEDSLALNSLQSGDVVLFIDGRPVHRRAMVFVPPLKTTYQYTIQREGVVLDTVVPFPGKTTDIGLSYRLPAGLLVSGFWLVAFVMLRYARRDNLMAVRVAYVFLGLAVALAGVQAEILSVPGAWLSRPIWFVAVIGIVYLGFVPRFQPLAPSVSRLFRWLITAAVGLGVVALIEAIWLFPQNNSVNRILGIGLYELMLFSGGLAWLSCLFVLTLRAWRMPPTSYERRQLQILLLFVGLATLPVTLLTLLPRALFDVVFLPFPLAIVVFILVPAGYLFVIYRRGYLGLDVVFSKSAAFLILALITLVVYGSTLSLVRTFLPESSNSISLDSLVFLPTLFLALYLSQPVKRQIDNLFFGQMVHKDSLLSFAAALSLKPELTTLENIVVQLAEDFHVNRAILVLTEENDQLAVVAQVNAIGNSTEAVGSLHRFARPLLRSADSDQQRHALFQILEWSELLLPVIVREKQVGYLALARPQDGYFNAEQVSFLARAADMIAIGSEAIYLFAAVRQFSLKVDAAHELERKNLSQQLHDQPEQIIIFVGVVLERILFSTQKLPIELRDTLAQLADMVKNALEQLHAIKMGLFPPVLGEGLESVVADVTDRFEREFDLTIKKQIKIPTDQRWETSLDRDTAVYRVLTEALNNVVKHAQTNDVCVSLVYAEESLRLEISDNGVGCQEMMSSISDLIRRQHLGLVGMFEWANKVQGSLQILPGRPQGTSVVLEIPLK